MLYLSVAFDPKENNEFLISTNLFYRKLSKRENTGQRQRTIVMK
jgi:hypothetical protein